MEEGQLKAGGVQRRDKRRAAFVAAAWWLSSADQKSALWSPVVSPCPVSVTLGLPHIITLPAWPLQVFGLVARVLQPPWDAAEPTLPEILPEMTGKCSHRGQPMDLKYHH